MTYSIDLRERAVKYVREGGKRARACEIYGISPKTLYNWLKMPSLVFERKRRGFTRKLDKEALAAHIRTYPDALLRERASHFGVRINAVWVAMKAMGYSKKNDTIQRDFPSK
jgi:transposase